jgi:hypothetical protein
LKVKTVQWLVFILRIWEGPALISSLRLDILTDVFGQLQSAFHEKVPAVERRWRLWCGSGGKFTGGWTKGLLLVENSMTHQRVTLFYIQTENIKQLRVACSENTFTVGVVIMFYIESH